MFCIRYESYGPSAGWGAAALERGQLQGRRTDRLPPGRRRLHHSGQSQLHLALAIQRDAQAQGNTANTIPLLMVAFGEKSFEKMMDDRDFTMRSWESYLFFYILV